MNFYDIRATGLLQSYVIMPGGRLPETKFLKQKNMSNFWPKKWARSFKKFTLWSLTREFLKQSLTEKQNGYL